MRLMLCSQDPRLSPLLTAALANEFQITVEPHAARLPERLAEEADVAIVDFDKRFLSLTNGLRLIEDCQDSGVPILVMTDEYSRSTALELMQRGVYECIQKPPSLVEIKVLVHRAHEHASMKRELAQTRRESNSSPECDGLIGASGKMQVVYDLIRRVANIDAFVLITGESGTGKELIARAIHNLSRRAQSPFVAVSCGAIPETLIEAELFGHERGAYTGAAGSRTGYLEEAAAGTLFMDEVGEISPATQVKLLRVLQQREFRRLGASRNLSLRARALFATHRNLADMVEEGTFRQDLFFRVNVMRIPVPALRDRTEDIPVLARHFLKQYATAYQKPVLDIRQSAMDRLVEYAWPGNVRELENVVQGAVIICDGDAIAASDLPTQFQGATFDTGATSRPASFEGRLRQTRLEVAQRAIMESNGNKTAAARTLGISRAYLHRLVKSDVDNRRVA